MLPILIKQLKELQVFIAGFCEDLDAYIQSNDEKIDKSRIDIAKKLDSFEHYERLDAIRVYGIP